MFSVKSTSSGEISSILSIFNSSISFLFSGSSVGNSSRISASSVVFSAIESIPSPAASITLSAVSNMFSVKSTSSATPSKAAAPNIPPAASPASTIESEDFLLSLSDKSSSIVLSDASKISSVSFKSFTSNVSNSSKVEMSDAGSCLSIEESCIALYERNSKFSYSMNFSLNSEDSVKPFKRYFSSASEISLSIIESIKPSIFEISSSDKSLFLLKL